RHSRLRYGLLAAREDAQAARALGISTFRARMMAMLLSSSMTAIGGSFYAFYHRDLLPGEVLGITPSVELMLAPVIGGVGTIFGPLVRALVLSPLGEGPPAPGPRFGPRATPSEAVVFGFLPLIVILRRPGRVWPGRCPLL